ncbi:MAG: malate synthase A [Bdellovibrionales bacterium]|nr:malate synthase A [Bdellovibrionales bacterium]
METFTVGDHTVAVSNYQHVKRIFTEDFVALLVKLHETLEPKRQSLLNARRERQLRFDGGEVPQFEPNKSEAVTGSWKVAPLPEILLTRRVEITGPVNSAKMVINMLSRNGAGARADCAMLDFEDSMKPSWNNVLDGVVNVIGAAQRSLSFTQDGAQGGAEKSYSLDPQDMALPMVRCRGLHLNESNVRIDGVSISGGLFDLAATYYHAAEHFIEQGMVPKYYVPKVEHYLEARWWDDLFSQLEDSLGHKRSTLRATFLIETLTAAFQIEEILYEIRDHAAGMNVGRWDKIFSDIKVLRAHPNRISADRSQIDMSCPWMKNYALRVIEICHGRGAFAMGGMAAFTPGKDEQARKAQTDKVIADKQFEFGIGHDGCWVSHPYFIGPALEQFKKQNQLQVTGVLPNKYPDLLPESLGTRTEAGVRKNIRVAIAYMQGWEHDIGCVAWDNLMEDLATLEISRAQIWQWVHHNALLDDGRPVTKKLVSDLFADEYEKIVTELGAEVIASGRWENAYGEAKKLFLNDRFQEFLSLESDLFTES